MAKTNKPAKTRTARFLKLAGMTASVAGRYAGQKLQDAFSDEESKHSRRSANYSKMANDITDTLGELKGAVMKVGQIASQTQDLLPKEISEALKKLQKEAPPVDFSVIAQQVEKELGAPPSELFKSFDSKPYAAASIGQVHRAVTKSGIPVVVKVQYPGVDRSVDSDLKQLKLTLKLGGLLKMPKESVDALFNEIRIRLNEELDYDQEAKNLRAFKKFHEGNEKLLIPRVMNQLSSLRVLTLEFIEGDAADELEDKGYSQTQINQLGNNLFDMLSAQLFDFQCIHGDPHPGNFAFRKDGSVIIYDFGCVKKLKPEIVQAYRDAIVASISEDYEAVDSALLKLGARVVGQASPGKEFYKIWRDIIFVPFLIGELFDFADADLHISSAKYTPLFFKHLHRFKPPVESLYIDRLVSGHYWILKSMGVQAAFKLPLAAYIYSDRYTQ